MLPKRFLFQFAADCRFREVLWTAKGAELDASYALPDFAAMEGGQGSPVELRMAWSPAGVAFSAIVRGKRQAPWCRSTRADDSDGLQLWIDTRDVHTVHRATRFCHRFLFMPTGGGARLDEPVVAWLPINRARENPSDVEVEKFQLASRVANDGYRLDAMIPAASLTGYDPEEYPRIGFNYALVDRELGDWTFTTGDPMPYKEDPSLWATLELVEG